MSTAIGTVGQGEFMSSKSLVEAAKIILSARPEGLSEDMLVHILLLDDRPFTGLGAHVYGTRSKSKNSLGNKGLSALRRTKGMRRVEGRWIYTGPPPAAPKSDDGEAVVRDEPSSPSSRCCKGCGAILRAGNKGEKCWPCDPVERDAAKLRPIPPPAAPRVRPERRKKAWTRDEVADEIRKWAEIHGRKPASHDWQVARKPGETRPSRKYVIDMFGTWNKAIEAAGFTPKPKPVVEKHGSPVWVKVMGLLPATSAETGRGIGKSASSALFVLKRMEAAGWVYRVQLPPKEGWGPGGDRYLWHPMPEGMERAA